MHEVIKVERETYENLKLENELLKEELKSLKEDITKAYNDMISGEQVTKLELSDELEEI